MNLWIERRHLPLRLATGAFILNSGVTKTRANEETAKYLHGFASGAYPFFDRLEARLFTKALATGEIVMGSALLLPAVPTVVAGVGLTAFATGLLGLYLRTPGMRRRGSLRPTQDGTALAKDVWLLAIGVSMTLDRS